jgi:hypothetical protein
MRSDDVIDVLDRLDAAGIEWWVDGGRIGGREVRCASARYQVAHARGRDAEALRSRIQHP